MADFEEEYEEPFYQEVMKDSKIPKLQKFTSNAIVTLLAIICFPYVPFISMSIFFLLVRFIGFKGKGEVLYTYSLLLFLLPCSQIWGLMMVGDVADEYPIVSRLLSLFLAIILSYTPCFFVKIVRHLFQEQEEKGEFILKIGEGLVLVPICLYLIVGSIMFA